MKKVDTERMNTRAETEQKGKERTKNYERKNEKKR